MSQRRNVQKKLNLQRIRTADKASYLNVITCLSPTLCKIRKAMGFLAYGKNDINHHHNFKTFVLLFEVEIFIMTG